MNITGQGEAYQCVNYPDNYGLAHLAIHENTDGEWSSKSMTHLTKRVKAFVRLDFSKNIPCLYNLLLEQEDSCSDRVNGVAVRVDYLNNILAALDTRTGNPSRLKLNDDLKRLTIYGSKSGTHTYKSGRSARWRYYFSKMYATGGTRWDEGVQVIELSRW